MSVEHRVTSVALATHRRRGAAAAQLAPAAACALLALSACTVGPNFERPASPLAEHWLGEPPGTAAEPTDMADWWKLFNDATLNSLIDTAYHNNLSLQVAAARILQAQAQLNVEIGGLFPQQQALSGQVHQRERHSSSTLRLPGRNPVLETSQIGFSASWEPDFWGKFRRGIEADRAAMLSSVAAYDSGLVSVTAGVASTYLNIRILQQQIEVVQESVATQQESRRIAQDQFDAGETSQLDLQQAETQLAQTQAQVPGLEKSLQAAKDSLAVLLGVTPETIDAMLGTSTAIPVAPREVATGIPKDLLRRRPDVREAEFTAAAQSAAIGVAKSSLYPAFTLTGNFGFAGTNLRGNSIGDLFSWENRAAGSGVSFLFPIFNYGRIVNSVRVQDAMFEQAILNYQNTVLQAQQEVEDGRASFAAAQVAMATLTEAAGSARRATALAIVRYKEGASDYTTVLTAQQLQLQIEQALASARGAVPLALVSVYRALGGGWQLREGQQLLPAGTRRDMKARTNWGSLPDSGPELPLTEESTTKHPGDAVAH